MTRNQLANYLFDTALLFLALVFAGFAGWLWSPVSLLLAAAALCLVFAAQHCTYSIGVEVDGPDDGWNADEEDEEP